jgi:hypothetical protein
MSYQPTHPTLPPDDVLASLDAAARSLAALDARGARLALAMDAQGPGLLITLDEGDGVRHLSPSELFELLA